MDAYSDTPWERQPCDETDRRFRAFLAYLDLPHPRQQWLFRVAYRFGVAVPTVRVWARRGLWADRAAALDCQIEAKRLDLASVRAEQAEDLERNLDVVSEQRAIFAKARSLIAMSVQKWADAESESEAPLLSVKELTALARVMLPQERVLAGAVSDRVELNLEGLSDSDLARLEAAMAPRP